MRLADFELFKDLLKEKSGLLLTPDKSYLLESRLSPVAKKWGYPTLEAMTLTLRGVPDRALIRDVIEAMTTNETSFFRDSRPFDTFRDVVLPYLLANRKNRKLRIWSAASSSGQEAYSLAMLLKESGTKISGWNIEILGTDISEDILESARRGLYSQFEVQRGLPVQMLMKYFSKDGEKWQINDDLRKMVRFQFFNLLDSMSSLGTFDVIFCRNVLIYFDEETKRAVLDKMSRQLSQDGFLFLGGAETVLGITDVFKPMPDRRGVYIRKDANHDNQTAALARG